MYAILQQSGHQYRVSPGDRLVVDRLAAEVGSVVALEPVVLVAGDDGTQIGSPVVDGVRVAAVVVSHRKGAKIRVFKYKPKKRYRRTHGHRSHLTELRVEAVLAAGEPLPEPKPAAEKPAPKAKAKAEAPAAEKPSRSRARAKAPEAEAPAAEEEAAAKPKSTRSRAAKPEASESKSESAEQIEASTESAATDESAGADEAAEGTPETTPKRSRAKKSTDDADSVETPES